VAVTSGSSAASGVESHRAKVGRQPAAVENAQTDSATIGDSHGELRVIQGRARLGRRTKLLVKHLNRGEIAVVDHLDLDRVSAEELIACGVLAVLNCRASSSGSYPNL
jgi:hypothetical protein